MFKTGIPFLRVRRRGILSGADALIVGLLAAWFNGGLFVVAISCCLTVLVTSFIF